MFWEGNLDLIGFFLLECSFSHEDLVVLRRWRLIFGRRDETVMKAQEMSLIKEAFDLQKEYAKKVALNLYNFMLSFEKVKKSISPKTTKSPKKLSQSLQKVTSASL